MFESIQSKDAALSQQAERLQQLEAENTALNQKFSAKKDAAQNAEQAAGDAHRSLTDLRTKARELFAEFEKVPKKQTLTRLPSHPDSTGRERILQEIEN